MAGEIFLEIEGLKGESVDTLHPDTIECHSISFGVSNPSSIGTGTTGHGSQRGTPSDISLMISPSKATAELWFKCVMGQHFDSGKIYLVKSAGDTPIDWEVLEMKKVFISSFQQSGSSGGGSSMESISLAYGELKITYKPQKTTDGTADADVIKGYNFETRVEA